MTAGVLNFILTVSNCRVQGGDGALCTIEFDRAATVPDVCRISNLSIGIFTITYILLLCSIH